jgi:transcription-repair coupling factor (superfamily II helicase)
LGKLELKLNRLLKLIEGMSSYRGLEAVLKQRHSARVAVLDAAKPYLVASLYHQLRVPVFVVTAQPENARRLYEQLLAWSGSEQLKLFPEPDALPYEGVSSDSSAEVERLDVLATLAGITDSNQDDSQPLVIASAHAFAQKVPLYSDFAASGHIVGLGMEVGPFELLKQWQAMGYRSESMVEVPGTMSHRGGILDIYPPTSELPARLEFFGNTIDSIRLFDPADQRSLKNVQSVAITPATELLTPLLNSRLDLNGILDRLNLASCNADTRERFERELALLLEGQIPDSPVTYEPLFNQDSIISYLPEGSLLVFDEPQGIKLAVQDLDAKSGELRAEKMAVGELPGDYPRPYFVWEELEKEAEERQRLALSSWAVAESEEWHRLSFSPAPSYAGQLPLLVRRAREMLGQGQRLVIVSHQASRLSELFGEEDIIAPPLNEIVELPQPGTLTLVQGLLTEGWAMDDTYLLTDAEIFGFLKQRRPLKKRAVPHHRLFVEVTPGDYVVHVEHGIARFAGMTNMGPKNGQKEYLVLEYAAGDKLYVPTDQMDRVTRYVGSGERPPVLSRLGTQEWSRTKQRVRESVAQIARELLTLYASREVVPGYAYSRDTVWQQELEGSFPYVETHDQMEVQGHVKEDMEKSKPMDRLVCGDVGYGKTEVAIRAAFKAVMDGKQVAVLVPTTVLAEQHYHTFKERLAAFPVKVEVLSRFRSHGEQQVIVEGLASGSVDICIGTHRMIQKDVSFKELGLLIIDEEQRFGVVHKEYLKQKRQEVDVLTLSATPIPRTLHMSLAGVRDMSVMETPPEERLPIKTHIAEYSERLIREAVIRELERGGQVFFVHNRVRNIGFIAYRLHEIVPEARVAIAHGQMPETQLEEVMADFIQGKSDILVCTSIIQSGLDMPNVNTLVVNQADKFGLTQLYQLRGRVGRGANLAYAYFLYDKGKRLTPVAEKRLRTIFEATELGAGFGIAMKDLEIRGAGTLLGVRQSGYISAVGFNLYTQLLAQAVEEQKARLAGKKEEEIPPSRLPSASVALPVPAFIPDEYVYDLNTRLGLYQKLATLEKAEQLETIAQELADRFGSVPPEVENLLYAIRIKIVASRAGIESVTSERGELVIKLFEGMRLDREKLRPFLDGLVPRIRDAIMPMRGMG